MFRLLPWSSVVGGNKVTAEEVKALAAPQHKSPAMEPLSIHKLKRKRTDSGEFEEGTSERFDPGQPVIKMSNATSQAASKLANTKDTVSATPDVTGSALEIPPPESVPNPHLSATTKKSSPITRPDNTPPKQNSEETSARHTKPMDPNTLRQTLDSQLSLEILLKHDELRLIDQEIAKCQVALEQLRRCSEIPFPATSSTGPSLSVSSGTGNPTAPGAGGRLPSSPPPWGVNNGPYSRHYARWLLPDHRFDGGEPEPGPPPAVVAGTGKRPTEGRATRASWTDASVPGPASRSQRSSAGTKLQALSDGYPPAKDKAGPMIIKRKSDGQLVKLVCIDCRRDNFSSTQGFINHCRIAHNRSFASHDAAAVASGEAVEVDETGAVVGRENEPSSSGPPGFVHPLIRSAHLVDPNAKSTPRNKSASQTPSQSKKIEESTPQTDQNRNGNGTTSATDDLPLRPPGDADDNGALSFKSAPQTPHLSALMQRRGLDLDLLNVVDDALTKSEIDMFSSGEDTGDEAAEPGSKDDKSPLNARGSRLPARTVVSQSNPQRPGSRKGADKGGRKPRPSEPLKPPPADYRYPYSLQPKSPQFTRQATQGDDIAMVDENVPNLSPNTVESNQAPSLISDDGEYGARSESESPIPSSSESNADEPAFDNIEVQDGDEGNETTTTTSAENRQPDPSIAGHGKHRPTPMSTTPSSAAVTKQKPSKNKQAVGPDANDETRRVSFVAPGAVPAASKKGNAKRQRRK